MRVYCSYHAVKWHDFLEQWRNLEKEEKEKYEEKAKRIAEEQQAKQEAAEKAFNESLNRSQSPWNEQYPAQSGTAARPSTPGNQSKRNNLWNAAVRISKQVLMLGMLGKICRQQYIILLLSFP